MNNEFKKVKSNEETRYVLETATAGATSSGAVATVAGGAGKVQKRNPDNILAQEANKTAVPANKPRNFVAKNAKMGGAGAHKDKKKAQKQGQEKHKKPYAEDVEQLKARLESLKENLADQLAAFAKQHGGKVRTGPQPQKPQSAPSGERPAPRPAPKYRDPNIDRSDDYSTWAAGRRDTVGEGGMKDYAIQQVVDQLLDGELDPYDVMNRPQGPAQEQMAMVLQDMYDDVAMDFRLHPDDDFEQIFDRVMDRLEDEYGHSGDQGVAEGSEQVYKVIALDKSNALGGKEEMTVKADSIEDLFARLSANDWYPLEINGIEVIAGKRLKQGVAEGDNPEYDDEAGMADNNLETLERAVQGIDELINAGDNLPEWCQEKIAVAKSMLVTVWDYMKSEEDRGVTEYGDTAKGQKMLTKVQKRAVDRMIKAADKGDAKTAGKNQDTANRAWDRMDTSEGLRDPKDNPCWKGYKPVGTKKKNGKTVPNCVPNANEDAYIGGLMDQLYEKAPPGDKYERMVKHIKKGYAKDGKVTDKEKSIAYATAWKAKNKSKK